LAVCVLLAEDRLPEFVAEVEAEAGFLFDKSKAPAADKTKTTAANTRTNWLRLMGYLLL
jgi:hypothetical protein